MTEPLEIGHDLNNGGGRYWAMVEGGSAELTYRNHKPGVILIDHTFVPEAARGRDIAQQLVERAVADARANNLKIIPQCPYVASLFRRRPDLDAVRAAETAR